MKKLFAAVVIVASLFGGFLLAPAPVGAAVDPFAAACEADAESDLCKREQTVGDVIQIIINILLFIVGIISVIMIIVGGLRYVASGGDANAVKGAKNTILFAVVGLVIAVIAFPIVNWVMAAIK